MAIAMHHVSYSEVTVDLFLTFLNQANDLMEYIIPYVGIWFKRPYIVWHMKCKHVSLQSRSLRAKNKNTLDLLFS